MESNFFPLLRMAKRERRRRRNGDNQIAYPPCTFAFRAPVRHRSPFSVPGYDLSRPTITARLSPLTFAESAPFFFLKKKGKVGKIYHTHITNRPSFCSFHSLTDESFQLQTSLIKGISKSRYSRV